jgi:hypothetical protein
MSIITDQPSTMGDTRFADLKKSRKSMKAFEGKQQDNTGVYTRELTDQEASKLWKALMHVLEKLYVSMTQKKKGLQLKI